MKFCNLFKDITVYSILIGSSIFFGCKSATKFENYISERRMISLFDSLIKEGDKSKDYFNSADSYNQSRETLESLKRVSEAIAKESLESTLVNLFFAGCCFGSGIGFLRKQHKKRYFESLEKVHRKRMALLY